MTSTPYTLTTTLRTNLLPVDPNRKSFAVFNKHGTNILYMKEGRKVSAANGIPIYPLGNVSLNTLEDGDTVKEAWSFIADGAATPIVIFEGS